MVRTYRQAVTKTLTGILAVWCIVAVLVVGLTTRQVGWSVESAWVNGQEGLFLSIVSLVIAAAGFTPSLLLAVRKADEGESHFDELGNRFLLGMGIRLPGTVALFLLSSYQLGASNTAIAIWVLLWHLVLLASEITLLHRVISNG